MSETEDQPVIDTTFAFERLPLVAEMELDRFCDHCGYNLRTQAVRRDPRTRILLCRCPECGRFHPATGQTSVFSPWLRRLATLLLAFWILVIGGGFIGLAIAEGAMTVVTVEDLGRRRYAYSQDTRRWQRSGLPLYMRTHEREYIQWVVGMAIGSLAVSFGGMALITVFCYHWRRWTCDLVAVAMPTLVGLVLLLTLRYGGPRDTLPWATSYIILYTLIQVLGGIFGIASGRPMARLVIRIFLPPRARQTLAFLWLADGKKPPSTAADPAAVRP